MRAVITGGAGFIGSHVSDILLQHNIEVLIIDDFSSGNIKNLGNNFKNLHVVEANILSEKCQIEIERFKPIHIFHHAGQVNVNSSINNPMEDAKCNIIATIKLLEIAKNTQVKNFIMASSAAVYGKQLHYPAKEEQTQTPLSPYGISKKSCEAYLDYYGKHTSLNTISLRYSNVYGPRQNAKGESGVVAIFFDHLAKKKPFTINGDGKQTRDFIFVEDVAKANIACVLNLTHLNFSSFNISSCEEISILELIQCMKKTSEEYGYAPIKILHGDHLPGELRRSFLSHEKIKKQMQWTPTTTLKHGIEKTCQYFQNEMNDRATQPRRI